MINEGLRAGDLDGIVEKRFSVDQYKSKMGDDKNILVLGFVVDGQAPARDLERFAEVGYKSVLDADATPGTLEDGKHRVFIEFARTPEVVPQIIAFLEDLKKLTNIDKSLQWKEKLNYKDIYSLENNGDYYYSGGWHIKAVYSAILGFIFSASTIWNTNLMFLQSFSWIIGAFISALIYYLLAKK